MATYPALLHTVVDAVDIRREAEFWRQLLGLVYRPGDEVPDGEDDLDWLVLTGPDGGRVLAFQEVAEQARTTWPSQEVPMQLHLDLTVPSVEELTVQHDRALALGATVLLDRTDDEDEPLYVFADPEGHPFCIFVAQEAAGSTLSEVPYAAPAGDLTGSATFRLMPTEEFHEGPSTVAVATAARGRALVLAYTWRHPGDGEQSGWLVLGLPGDDGAVSAAWVDSWHQPDVIALTGRGSGSGATVGYEYAPGWMWEVEVRVASAATEPRLALVMRNVVPAGEAEPTGPYDVMRADWG